MLNTLCIAPARIVTGFGAVAKMGTIAAAWGRKVLLVGGENSFPLVKAEIEHSLDKAEVAFVFSTYGRDSSETSVSRLAAMAEGCNAVVGVGGGKALDTAKMVSLRCALPVLTIPTSPATCAAWSALSNEYSEEGVWQKTVLHAPPDAMLLDYEIVRKAPSRLFASGIADALAKWYEGKGNASPNDLMVMSALATAKLLKEKLFELAPEAVRAARAGKMSESTVSVIDAAVQLPGVVGGIGGEKCRSVAAHAFCNALTSFPGSTRSLHGEKVGFGILVQLFLEGAPLGEIEELHRFFRSIGLPLSLKELGVDPARTEDIAHRCLETQSSLGNLPFPVTPDSLAEGIRHAGSLALNAVRI